MSTPFYPGQPDYFDKLNEMNEGVTTAIEVGEGAAGAAASATASANAAAAAKAASDAAAASAAASSQAAASDAASAQVLVGMVPPQPFPADMPWAVTDRNDQPILGVTSDGRVHAVLDRLPGLDMLDSRFAWSITDADGYVLFGIEHGGGIFFPGMAPATQDRLPGADILDGRFAYAICDSQGYVLWGIQWDGNIYSLGQSSDVDVHAMVLRGDLWAVGSEGLPVQITEATEVADPAIAGSGIKYLARSAGGLRPAVASIPSADSWAPFVTNVLHILGSGQSLAMGNSSTLNSVNPQCANVMKTLKIGVRTSVQTYVLTPEDCTPLVPMRAFVAETPIVQCVAQLQRNSARPISTGLVASLHGQGGLAIAQLSKGTVHYSNAITAATAVAADCAVKGLGYRVPHVDWIQGEGDYAAAPGAYTAALLQLQSDYDTDLRAISGQARPVRIVLDQISNWTVYGPTSNVPLEQLQVALDHPDKVLCAGPKYWLPTVSDGLHLPSLSARRGGAMHARAAEASVNGVDWLPTHCTSASRAGAVITLKFHTPYGHLVADTVNVADPGNLGIRWVDSTNSAVVQTVAVRTGNTVVVTLSSVPTGANGYIGIADIGTNGAGGGPTTGPRACLRDTSTDKCGDGLPLYNWACHQRIAVI